MQGTLFVTIVFTLSWTIGGAADLSDLPETEVAVVGSDVSLKCPGDNNGELRWTKYKTFRDSEVPDVVNYGSNVRNEFATRYTVKHEFDENILTITGAFVEDTGRFVCGDSAKVDRHEIMLLVIDSSCRVESTFAETFSALPGQPNSSDIVCTLKYTRTEPPTRIRCSFSQNRDVNFSHPTIYADYATYTSRVPATCSSIADVPLTCFGNFNVTGTKQSYAITAKWKTALICSHWRMTIFVVGGCLVVLLLTLLFTFTAISVRRCMKARKDFEVGTDRSEEIAPSGSSSVRVGTSFSKLYARVDRRSSGTNNINNNSAANGGCDTYEKSKPVPEYRPNSGCAYINAVDEEPEVFETADGRKRYLKNVNVKNGACANKDSLNLKPILKKPAEQEPKCGKVTHEEPQYEPDELFVEKEDNVEFFEFDPYDKVKVDD